MGDFNTIEEAKLEIERLRELVRFADQKHKRRTARVQLIVGGEQPAEGKATLRWIVTCPSTINEMDFGRYVAHAMVMFLNSAQVTKAEVDSVGEIFPPDKQG